MRICLLYTSEPSDSALLHSAQVVLGSGDDLLKRTNYTRLYAYNMNQESVPAVISGTGLFDVIEKSSGFFTVSHTSLMLDRKTNKQGVLLSGISGGQEIEIFAPEDECKVYKIDFSNGEFIEPSSENMNLAQIGPCDILLYNQSINGQTTKLYVLKNVEEIIKIDSADLQDSFLPNRLLKVATFQADGKEYAYYLGYVLSNTGNTCLLYTSRCV